MRASLEQVRKATGRTPEQLMPKEGPDEMLYLLNRYWEVSDGEPLSYQKLYYWDKVMGYGCKRWEYRALILLDRVRWSLESE